MKPANIFVWYCCSVTSFACLSAMLPWWDSGWNASEIPRLLYVRMLASRSSENVMTRVMSAWNARPIRSNIIFKCVSMSFGTPIGASGIVELRSVGRRRPSARAARSRGPSRGRRSPVRGPAPEPALQTVRVLRHGVEDATRLVHDRLAFRIRVALPEQPVEHRARVRLLRQRLLRRAPRDLRAAQRGRELEGRQPRLLTDVPRRESDRP